jgi:peptidoglycan/LPS O-acetylase OafA/YrhL
MVLLVLPNEQLWRAQASLWTYTANYWIAWQSGWNKWAETIVPLWSLSVEEQFYLVWPLVVYRFSLRALIRICIGVMVVAFIFRMILTLSGANWFALYTWAPARADSLAAGALAALGIRGPDGQALIRRVAKIAGPVALLLIVLFARGFDPVHHPWQRLALYSLLAIFFTALLAWSINPQALRGIPNRFYENRVLRAVGGYSYGIYIVHLPLMYLTIAALTQWGWYDPMAPTWSSGFALIAVNVAMTAAVAFVSFHGYEKQFLKLKRFFPVKGNTPCIS